MVELWAFPNLNNEVQFLIVGTPSNCYSFLIHNPFLIFWSSQVLSEEEDGYVRPSSATSNSSGSNDADNINPHSHVTNGTNSNPSSSTSSAKSSPVSHDKTNGGKVSSGMSIPTDVMEQLPRGYVGGLSLNPFSSSFSAPVQEYRCKYPGCNQVCVEMILLYVCIHVCMHVCMHVCTCMYVCIHVCIHACMYVCMYVCIHVCMYVCMYIVCMYVCMHVCMYVTMYVYMYTCTCMYVCMYMYVYMYVYTCTCMCVYIYRSACIYYLCIHGVHVYTCMLYYFIIRCTHLSLHWMDTSEYTEEGM